MEIEGGDRLARGAHPGAPPRRGDDSRTLLRGLDESIPFAAGLPARSGGWQAGALVAGFALVVHLVTLATEVTDPAIGHRLALLLRDGLDAGSGGGLWCALARFLESQPLGGTPAWRIGLASAIPGAAAAGLLAVWLRQRDIGRRAAVAGGLLFAFALPVWRSAVLPGPIPLALCLSLLSLVLIEESRGARRELPRLLAWAIAGIAGMQGPEALAMMLAVAAATALRPGALPRAWALGPALLVSGALLAALIGGSEALRAPYLPHPAGWDPSLPGEAIGRVAASAGPTWIVAAIGLIILWRRHPGDAGTLTILGVVPLVAALLLGARGTTAGEPPELVLAVPLLHAALAALAAGGIDAVLQRLAATPGARSHALTAASAALPLALLAIGTRAADHSDSRVAAEWSESVLRSLPEQAIIVAGNDPRGGLLEYAQLVAGERPDVLIADPAGEVDPARSPLLELSPPPAGPGEAIAAIAARSSRPLFSIAPTQTSAGRWSPWGIVWRLDREGAAVASESEAAWQAIRIGQLPDDPARARAWLDGEIARPPLDRTIRRIASEWFLALARREGAISESGRWGEVLARIPALRAGLPRPREREPAPTSSGSDDSPARGSGAPRG